MSVSWGADLKAVVCQQRFTAFLIPITSVSGTIIPTTHNNHQSSH